MSHIFIFYVLSIMSFIVSFWGLAGFPIWVLLLMHCPASGPYFMLFTA